MFCRGWYGAARAKHFLVEDNWEVLARWVMLCNPFINTLNVWPCLKGVKVALRIIRILTICSRAGTRPKSDNKEGKTILGMRTGPLAASLLGG